MMNATEQAGARNVFSESAPVELSARVAGEPVHLLQVHLDGRPLPRPTPGITFCLDVHENTNAMAAAVEYVRRARASEPGSVLRFSPSIFALVNTSALSREQLAFVNDELIPAGTSIFEYPKTCRSFREAMYALFEEMKETRRAHAKYQAKGSYFSDLVAKVVHALVGPPPAVRTSAAVGSETRSSLVDRSTMVNEGSSSRNNMTASAGE